MAEKPLPNYEVVPLRSEEITICVIQSTVSAVDASKADEGKRERLDYMVRLIDLTRSLGSWDLLAFHEFPLHGFEFWWNREQIMRVGVDIPGPETARLGEKAKQYNCYIQFGCYGKLPDWPGHFTNMGVIIGPSGDIILKRWRLYNLGGMGFSTTVHDVLDEYVERYGWEAVLPIARTDIGNIGILPIVLDPVQAHLYAMKGVEILIRYMTAGAGGYSVKPFLNLGGQDHTFRKDLQMSCFNGNHYGVFVNNALPTISGMEFDLGSGASAIIDCNGQIMAEASSIRDTMVTAMIPLAAYRKKHSIPNFYKELFLHFLNEEYVAKYPPNSFSKSLPNNIAEADKIYRQRFRW